MDSLHPYPPAPPPSARPRVLVVDDTPANLQAFEVTLESLDVDLVLANSGYEALRHLLLDDFAVILLDVRMPGMDGLETATLIRSGGRARHTPIIFVSAYERTPVEVAEGYLAGAIDYLFSPVDPETLKRKVRGFVEVYRIQKQLALQAEASARMVEFQQAKIKELEDTLRNIKREQAQRPQPLA